MLVVDTTETDALALFAAVAAHAGPLAELGRPVLAVGDQLVTDLGESTAVLAIDDKSAVRTVELPSGTYEVTRWRNGVELSRAVGRPEEPV
jgi:hypothetical protein